MKVKRDDTEESRRYWQMAEENSKVVASWPEWKRGARPATPPVASQAEVSTPPGNGSGAPPPKK